MGMTRLPQSRAEDSRVGVLIRRPLMVTEHSLSLAQSLDRAKSEEGGQRRQGGGDSRSVNVKRIKTNRILTPAAVAAAASKATPR